MASSEPYLASVDLWAGVGRLIPNGWTVCYGQLLSISQNQALYAVMGKAFGGDGVNTFGLPDMRGRVPVGVGKSPTFAGNYIPGQMGGTETVTLTVQQMPSHKHPATFNPSGGFTGSVALPVQNDSMAASGTNPVDKFLGPSSSETIYYDIAAPYATLAPASVNIQAGSGAITVGNNGGSQPFNIMQPYTVLFYIIALQGLFPTPDQQSKLLD